MTHRQSLATVLALTVLAFAGCLAGTAVMDQVADRYEPYRVVGTSNGSALVKFCYRDETADRIFIAGDFNRWVMQCTASQRGAKSNLVIPMERVAGTSVWTATVPLKPGEHPYCYEVYYTNRLHFKRDTTNPYKVEECFSCDGYNSVLIIDSNLAISRTNYTQP